MAGQRLGLKEVDDRIWLVTCMAYDLGCIALQQKTLQPIANPFGKPDGFGLCRVVLEFATTTLLLHPPISPAMTWIFAGFIVRPCRRGTQVRRAASTRSGVKGISAMRSPIAAKIALAIAAPAGA